ncbi:MAG TPA: hypothetical protein VGR62_07530 [Candidatus Binatia bacterium]|jgi:DNA-binding beta-propeller fold protein YncE|nr:hypothetical protein [Candidatus Binatia bacterium]
MRRHLTALLVATLLLMPRPGRTAEPAFVVNQATNDVSVVDLQTATVAFSWGTNSNPRAIAIAPNDLTLYVAAGNDVTVIDVLRPVMRVRLDVTLPFIEATGVAVSRDGGKLFVIHRTNILPNLSAAVTMINLQDQTVAACLRDRTDPCTLGAGEIPIAVPFTNLVHVAVSPWDGSVWVINTDGRMARAATPGQSFVEVATSAMQRALNPGGMAIGSDGNVALAANGNCGAAAACVKVVVPSLSNMLVTRSETFAGLGRLAIGAPTMSGSPVLLSVPPSGLLSRIAAGPQTNFMTGPNPVAAGAGALGTLFTVNENTMPGNGTVSVIGIPLRTVTVGSLPRAAVTSPREMRGMLRAEQRVLSWTYTNPFGEVGTPQTVQFRNRGFAPLTVTGVRIEGVMGTFGPGRVNFLLGGNTCIGATLAFQQTCDVTVGFRSSPAQAPFTSGDRATLSLVSTASHAETVTLLASSRQLRFP